MRFPFSGVFVALSVALFLNCSRALAGPPVIDTPPLTAFDGRTWAGMMLASSTRDDIKKNYATRGARGDDQFLRSGALILTPPARDDDGDVRAIQALVDGTRGDAKLTGIRVVYGEFAPYIKDISRAWGDTPQRYFAKTRYSEWYIVAFPRRGLALITTDDQGSREESVRLAFLTTPRRLQSALNAFSASPTPIRDINDDMALESDHIQVGSVDTNVDINGMDIWGADFMRDDIRRKIRDRLSRANVDINPGQTGYGTISISISYERDKGGSITATANINGQALRRSGPQSASATGYGYQSLPKSRRDAENELKWRLQAAIDQMLNNLSDNVRAAIKKLGPPTPEDYRKGVWDNFINNATK